MDKSFENSQNKTSSLSKQVSNEIYLDKQIEKFEKINNQEIIKFFTDKHKK